MNIQKSMSDLFGNACYAFTIAWINSTPEIRDDIIYLTYDVIQGLTNGFIEMDGFVREPAKYANMCLGDKVYRDVEKVKITSLNDLPAKGVYAVEFNYGVKKHFVACEKGRVVFDPWENSETVKYGKPTSYRKYISY